MTPWSAARRVRWLATLISVALIADLTQSQEAPTQVEDRSAPRERDQFSGREIYGRLLRSAAWIVVQEPGRKEFAWGSGWLVDRADCLVVTNHHVVAKGLTLHPDEHIRVYFPEYREGRLVTDRVRMLREGRGVRARIVDSDPKRDLAVLQLEYRLDGVEPLPLALESSGPGERVHSIGNPSASEALWVYTSGTVRQVYRARVDYGDGQVCDFVRVETQSPINAGDSGGPVANDRGELVAVNQGHLSRELAALMSYFIDVQEVRALLDEVRPLLNPRTAEEFARRGIHYRNRGRHDLAVADLTEALRQNPEQADWLTQRGLAFLGRNDSDTALADFDAALRIDPDKVSAHVGRGEALEQADDHEGAIQAFTEAIRREPGEADFYNSRGCCHHSLKNYRRAEADFTQAIQLDPNHPTYHDNRGTARLALDEPARALPDFDQAIRLHPRKARYLFHRAEALWDLKRFDEAERDFAKAERIDPDDARSRLDSYQESYLYIHNQSRQRVRLYVKYHTFTKQKRWEWFPGGLDADRWAVYLFEPGEANFLSREGFRVRGDRVRLWFQTVDTSLIVDKYKERDLILVEPAGYEYYRRRVFTYTIRD
jgi:tetratricopeptide (TPR) repeat protein